ncbi:MAG: GxxExxY protein [Gemmatimonadaceae bacterium]|nr:GxxExxY protein [Gemmatimonadaceae bacterium]
MDWDLSERVIGAAIEVHRELGPGLVERVYEECFCWMLVQKGLSITRQHHVPVTFHGLTFPAAFRLDVIVENRLVIEIKSVEQLLRLHQSQLLTYLKMANKQSGLLINFNTSPLKDGIKRVIAP